MLNFDKETKVRVNKAVECRKVGTDYVLYHHEMQKIISLNTSASLIFELLEEFQNVNDILTEYYSRIISSNKLIEREKLETDVLRTLQKLYEIKVIDMV